MLLASMLAADTHHVESDDKTDFSKIKTFAIVEGHATSRNAEITSKLTLKTIEDSIRSGLLSRGLKETSDHPDLSVTFNLTEAGQRGVVGRGIQNSQVVTTSVGTLVIDMTLPGTRTLVWHGIYTDDENNAAKLAKNLPNDAKKLISEYPPKKK